MAKSVNYKLNIQIPTEEVKFIYKQTANIMRSIFQLLKMTLEDKVMESYFYKILKEKCLKMILI